MCFGCSKEPSHRDGSFEYPQHMFWLRNKKNKFQLRTLIWGPGCLWSNFCKQSEPKKLVLIWVQFFDPLMLFLYVFTFPPKLVMPVACSLLATFANSLDRDQARQHVGPDLDSNGLALMVFL